MLPASAHTSSPEARLWRAGISRAVQDATLGAGAGITPAERDAARRWLTTPSRDLWEVCDMAEVAPGALLEQMRRLAAAGWPAPAIDPPKPSPPPKVFASSGHGRVGRPPGRNPAIRAAQPVALELRAAGMTLREIAAELDARGLPTAKGGPWRYSTVFQLLAA